MTVNSELCAYGVMMWEMWWRNLIFAYDNGLSTDDGPFCDWCLKTIEETVDLFIEKFGRKYDEAVTEPMAKVRVLRSGF